MFRPRRLAGYFALGLIAAAPASSRADTSCLAALDALGVSYERVDRPGLAIGVSITGDLGGVEYVGYVARELVLDCSLAYSLAMAGVVLRAHGIERAIYSGAYTRRTIRNSSRPSSHSFGLAIDVHEYEGEELGRLRIQDDYEQGLGSARECLGAPLTEGGAILRDLHCRLEEAALFRFILSPDYDAHHFDHFHFEALPWAERDDVS
jgi:hypothetical protein